LVVRIRAREDRAADEVPAVPVGAAIMLGGQRRQLVIVRGG
jgi:hypothetical protein